LEGGFPYSSSELDDRHLLNEVKNVSPTPNDEVKNSGVQSSHFLTSWLTSCFLPFCKFWQGSLPKSAEKEETRKQVGGKKGHI
jgi:hypothetical protein